MKTVLVVDWLDKFAGAERVIKSLDSVFEFDDCHALVNVMSADGLAKVFNGRKVNVKTTGLQFFGGYFRLFLVFFPFFVKRIKISDCADVIISSSHAVAKSVGSKRGLHISYFQARNLKYVWDEEGLYFSGVRSIFRFFLPYLRRFDLESSYTPHFIVSNSNFVRDWVKRVYGRDSYVIYPPVDVDDFDVFLEKEDYYVTVGRLERYKRFDLVVEAFARLGKKLIVIGDGAERRELEKKSSENIIFKGFLPKEELVGYVSRAKAFVYCGVEDFGIAPVEAQACGTPVICYGEGGVRESVVDGVTGVFFESQTVDSLVSAIERFEIGQYHFDPMVIRSSVLKFGRRRFEEEIRRFVFDKYGDFLGKRSA